MSHSAFRRGLVWRLNSQAGVSGASYVLSSVAGTAARARGRGRPGTYQNRAAFYSSVYLRLLPRALSRRVFTSFAFKCDLFLRCH